jgi:hypothetical protein
MSFTGIYAYVGNFCNIVNLLGDKPAKTVYSASVRPPAYAVMFHRR